MNRLKGSTVYLSGAIDAAKDFGAGWRNYIAPLLQDRYGFKVFDPLKKPLPCIAEDDLRVPRAEWKEKGEFEKLSKLMRKIRCIDLRMIDKSDVVIIYLDLDIKMAGTWEEFYTANRQKKPCLVVCPQGIGAISDWVFGVMDSKYMFNNFEELFIYLDEIDRSEDEEYLSRWIFFDN